MTNITDQCKSPKFGGFPKGFLKDTPADNRFAYRGQYKSCLRKSYPVIYKIIEVVNMNNKHNFKEIKHEQSHAVISFHSDTVFKINKLMININNFFFAFSVKWNIREIK